MSQRSYSRLLAIDPSVTCSGWACFALPGGEVVGVGELRGVPPGPPIAERISAIQQKIVNLLEHLQINIGDLVILEGATTMRDPRAALLVEQVRTIFEAIARQRGATVPGRINPRSVQFEVIGLRGAQACRADVKFAALRVAHALYAERLVQLGLKAENLEGLKRHQDLVDALLIGTLAVSRVRTAQESSRSLESIFDMVEWRSRRASSKLISRAQAG